MKSSIKNYSATVLIMGLCALLQYKYINEFPSYIHAWSQSDHYALSLGFVDNGLNFFKPQTYVMNRQLDDGRNVASETRITAVDFPLHDYLPAVLMKIAGNTSPWLFRIYTMLYSIVGLLFLYKLILLYTGDEFKSYFLVVFAATCPVYVYYQSGFIPSVPSASSIIIAAYFYLKYHTYGNNKHLFIAYGFFTLAALCRLTFVIPLIAIMCTQLLRVLRKQESVKENLVQPVVSIVVIVAYHLYNNYLRRVYGSMFLNHLMPANNWQQAKAILTSAWENWGTHYFSEFHYAAMVLIIIAAAFYRVRHTYVLSPCKGSFIIFCLTMLLGYIFFAVAMLKQFADHDYYFLDTFFVPLLLLLMIIMAYIPAFRLRRLSLFVLMTILSVPVIVNAIGMQKQRRQTGFWDRTMATINNYQDANLLLDSLGISRNATILAIDAYAPNIPFIQMKRKGFAVLSTTHKLIQESMAWKYDYITVQNAYFVSDVFSAYPEFINGVKVVADNGRIMICKPIAKRLNTNLSNFLGLDTLMPLYNQMLSFNGAAATGWENIKTEAGNTKLDSMGVITSDMEYGPVFKSNEVAKLMKKCTFILFDGMFKLDELKDCDLLVSVDVNGINRYYQTYNLKSILKPNTHWQRAYAMFCLPPMPSGSSNFTLGISNNEKNTIKVDDLTFKIYTRY